MYWFCPKNLLVEVAVRVRELSNIYNNVQYEKAHRPLRFDLKSRGKDEKKMSIHQIFPQKNEDIVFFLSFSFQIVQFFKHFVRI